VAAVLDADAGSAGAAVAAQLKTLRAHGRLKSLGKGRAGENGISLDILMTGWWLGTFFIFPYNY
jgi:hypothetical protein